MNAYTFFTAGATLAFVLTSTLVVRALTPEEQAASFMEQAGKSEQAGDFLSAERFYRLVLRVSPENRVAQGRIEAIRGEIDREVRKMVPGGGVEGVVVPIVDFEQTVLEDALKYLRVRVHEVTEGLILPEVRVSVDGDDFFSDPSCEELRAKVIPSLRLRNVPVQDFLNFVCDATSTRFYIAKPRGERYPVIVIQSADGANTPLAVTPDAPAEKTPVWRDPQGREIEANFVGLDGEAVVVNRNGEEVTIPFSLLDEDSLKQAARFDQRSTTLLHYDFSDGLGDLVADLSGNGRHGRLTGFTNMSSGAGDREDASGWTTSGGLKFDGKGDHVVTQLTTGEFGSGSFTIESVASNTAPESTWSFILGVDRPSADDAGVVEFGKNAGNAEPFFRVNGLDPAIMYSKVPGALADSRLHHLALVHDADAGEVRLFIDHRQVTHTPEVSGKLNGDARVWIGHSRYAGASWSGVIKEVRVSKRALSPDDFLPNPNPVDPVAPDPGPVHRYAFDGDLTDSAGGLDGTLLDPGAASARFSEGQLDLTGNRGEPSSQPGEDAYVDLPNGLISRIGDNVSFELWATSGERALWARLFEFGSSGGGEGNAAAWSEDGIRHHLLLSPVDETGQLVACLCKNRPGGQQTKLRSHLPVAVDRELHYALVIDAEDRASGPAGSMTLYVDGFRVASTAIGQEPGSSLADENCWLGRSQYAEDRMFRGRYNEFRIYDRALSADEIMGSFLAGPDAPIGE